MKLPTPIPPEGPRQMIMAFDSVKTRGMSPPKGSRTDGVGHVADGGGLCSGEGGAA